LSEFFSDLPIGQGRRKTGHIDNLRLQANASAYGIFQDIRMLKKKQTLRNFRRAAKNDPKLTHISPAIIVILAKAGVLQQGDS
jgi:hypothetical protein